MSEGTIVRDFRKRNESEGKSHVVTQKGGNGTPVYLAPGDFCAIGRPDPEKGYLPQLYFTDGSVSRFHAGAYISKEDNKLYLIAVSLAGTFIPSGVAIETMVNGSAFPGGKLVSVDDVVGPLNSGILGKNLDERTRDFIVNALKTQKKIGPDGFPTKEDVPRRVIARVDIGFYYPRAPAKAESVFKLSRKDSDLEIIAARHYSASQ